MQFFAPRRAEKRPGIDEFVQQDRVAGQEGGHEMTRTDQAHEVLQHHRIFRQQGQIGGAPADIGQDVDDAPQGQVRLVGPAGFGQKQRHESIQALLSLGTEFVFIRLPMQKGEPLHHIRGIGKSGLGQDGVGLIGIERCMPNGGQGVDRRFIIGCGRAFGDGLQQGGKLVVDDSAMICQGGQEGRWVAVAHGPSQPQTMGRVSREIVGLLVPVGLQAVLDPPQETIGITHRRAGLRRQGSIIH